MPVTVLWLPVVLAPYVILMAGIAWLLSSLGVYLRDLAQIATVIATVLMFMSPVFYPIDALPAQWQAWVYVSPMTLILEQTRAVLLLGKMPDLMALAVYAALALGFAAASLYWFQRTRKGFADVL